MEIETQFAFDPDLDSSWFRAIAKRAIKGEDLRRSGTLAVITVDDEAIRRINRDFLGKDRPTDVIAFNFGDGEEDIWAEIYISVERAKAQSRTYGVSYEEEMARLLVHGILHLAGHDDRSPVEKRAMRRLESAYLPPEKPDEKPGREKTVPSRLK